jgi:hypothetical protein
VKLPFIIAQCTGYSVYCHTFAYVFVFIGHPVKESVDRDLGQALTGLDLCPSRAGLASARHNDLLEVPREFSGSSGVPGLERRYSYG